MAATIRAAAPTADVVTRHLDQGYVFGRGGKGADAEASRPLLAAYAAGPEEALVRAVAAWRPDVLAADATPWAPVLTHAAGAPPLSARTSSGTTSTRRTTSTCLEAASDVASVRAQVAEFDLALELPLGPGAPTVATRPPSRCSGAGRRAAHLQ